MVAPELIKPDWDAPANVIATVTTRVGGVSATPYQSWNLAQHVGDDPAAVDENRQLLERTLGDSLQWQWLEQVHSDKVTRVDSPAPMLVADGLITARSGLVCCVLTADCLSVFIAAVDGSEVAVVHAGWRGMAAGIIANAVRGMSKPPGELLVWLGPAIGPCHFEVGAEVREAFLQLSPATRDCFEPAADQQKFMADLFSLARVQLRELGVAQVTGGGECTYCLSQKYYSFRRNHVTGRQLSMIYLRPGHRAAN